jgi:type IX secretion system PorP/SprF family membrane protein
MKKFIAKYFKIIFFKYFTVNLFIICFSTSKICSQDAEFSQFFSNPLYLNPAFAGTNSCPRFSTNHRAQWTGLPNVFNTTSFSYDQNIDKIHGGLGIIIINDKLASSIQTNRISGIYSYDIKFSKNFHFRTGFEASFWQNKLDYSQLNFVDMIDPLRGFVNQSSNSGFNDSRNGVDFSTGFLGYSDKIFFGFSAHHLTQPQQLYISNVSKLERKYTFNIGAHLPINSTQSLVNHNPIIISPNIIWKEQGINQQLNIGIYAEKGPYALGFWYRDNNNYTIILGGKIGLMKIGYSYGLNLSRLYIASAGSHEISVQINFGCDNKNQLYKTLSCPSF